MPKTHAIYESELTDFVIFGSFRGELWRRNLVRRADISSVDRANRRCCPSCEVWNVPSKIFGSSLNKYWGEVNLFKDTWEISTPQTISKLAERTAFQYMIVFQRSNLVLRVLKEMPSCCLRLKLINTAWRRNHMTNNGIFEYIRISNKV